MNKNVLLEQLKIFTEEVTKDMKFPLKEAKGDLEPYYDSVSVYKMRLPSMESATKKAPYIIHQVITGHDIQDEGKRTKSTAQIRSIFCVYCNDSQEGSLLLLELMERVRIGMLKIINLNEQFQLDRQQGIETLIYPDDTAPFYAGEMITTWRLPAVEREVTYE